ncbi:hypothetical protein A1QC_15290 [Vibrio rumoiensis 1S-45]|uniref:Uncharacterized protein n=2 Tax=Vibrio rumoiensis TaxID=76258 RepID=A0A1E5E3H4_9VIBR|nr:hypothetical protein A1QC_15290 [Vibrio rumoiensis 1S-45]
MPPNSFGVDWSNMNSGGIEAQADTNQAVAHVDSVMKENATSKEAIADYVGIGAGLGSCVTFVGCGAGLTNAAIAFSDLGEVLSQGISVNPVDNDPIQKGVISIMPDFVGKEQNKKLASDIVLGLPTVKSLIDINKSISKPEAIMDSLNKSLDILSVDILHDTIKSDLNEVDSE